MMCLNLHSFEEMQKWEFPTCHLMWECRETTHKHVTVVKKTNQSKRSDEEDFLLFSCQNDVYTSLWIVFSLQHYSDGLLQEKILSLEFLLTHFDWIRISVELMPQLLSLYFYFRYEALFHILIWYVSTQQFSGFTLSCCHC